MTTTPMARSDPAMAGVEWLEGTLGRGHRVRLARIDLDRLPQRPRQPLVAGLDDVVAVPAIEVLDVQRHAGMLGEGLEPLLEQLGVEVAELVAGELHLPDEIGAV